MGTTYVILGQSEVIAGYNSITAALNHIKEIRKLCPRHTRMSIYKLEFTE